MQRRAAGLLEARHTAAAVDLLDTWTETTASAQLTNLREFEPEP